MSSFLPSRRPIRFASSKPRWRRSIKKRRLRHLRTGWPIESWKWISKAGHHMSNCRETEPFRRKRSPVAGTCRRRELTRASSRHCHRRHPVPPTGPISFLAALSTPDSIRQPSRTCFPPASAATWKLQPSLSRVNCQLHRIPHLQVDCSFRLANPSCTQRPLLESDSPAPCNVMVQFPNTDNCFVRAVCRPE